MGYLFVDIGHALPRNGVFDDAFPVGRTPYFACCASGTIPYFAVYHQRTANARAKRETQNSAFVARRTEHGLAQYQAIGIVVECHR